MDCSSTVFVSSEEYLSKIQALVYIHSADPSHGLTVVPQIITRDSLYEQDQVSTQHMHLHFIENMNTWIIIIIYFYLPTPYKWTRLHMLLIVISDSDVSKTLDHSLGSYIILFIHNLVHTIVMIFDCIHLGHGGRRKKPPIFHNLIIGTRIWKYLVCQLISVRQRVWANFELLEIIWKVHIWREKK